MIIDVVSETPTGDPSAAAASAGAERGLANLETTSSKKPGRPPDELSARNERIRSRMRSGMTRVVSAARKVGATMKGVRDAAVEIGAATWISQRLEAFGSLDDLRIDSRSRTVHLKVHLLGESEPLTIEIREYEFCREGTTDYLVMTRVETSRAWVTQVFREFVLHKRFEVPGPVRMALS